MNRGNTVELNHIVLPDNYGQSRIVCYYEADFRSEQDKVLVHLNIVHKDHIYEAIYPKEKLEYLCDHGVVIWIDEQIGFYIKTPEYTSVLEKSSACENHCRVFYINKIIVKNLNTAFEAVIRRIASNYLQIEYSDDIVLDTEADQDLPYENWILKKSNRIVYEREPCTKTHTFSLTIEGLRIIEYSKKISSTHQDNEKEHKDVKEYKDVDDTIEDNPPRSAKVNDEFDNAATIYNLNSKLRKANEKVKLLEDIINKQEELHCLTLKRFTS